uniref:Uncharacterized protein n=1 Tax=Sander lucioperca TaxID=283035 RepID=A0A8C9ZYD0_SANLU
IRIQKRFSKSRHQSQPLRRALHQSQPLRRALHQSQPLRWALHQSQPLRRQLPHSKLFCSLNMKTLLLWKLLSLKVSLKKKCNTIQIKKHHNDATNYI